MELTSLLQIGIAGVCQGAIYLLVALGFYSTWMAHRGVSFAQGECVVLGTFLFMTLVTVLGISYPLAFIAVVLASALIGLIIYFIAIRPTIGKGFSFVVSTIGVMYIMQNVVTLVWGERVLKFPSFLPESVVYVGRIGIRPVEIFIIVVSFALMGLYFVFLRSSRFGKAINATSYNPALASLVGINPAQIVAFSYALATAMAGFAGILIGPITFASPYAGFPLIVNGFIAAILGGFENPLGIFIGAVSIGVIQAFVSFLWSSELSLFSTVILLIIILAIWPTGLTGGKLAKGL
jgi:branched-chain amino acid transport system permease protein